MVDGEYGQLLNLRGCYALESPHSHIYGCSFFSALGNARAWSQMIVHAMTGTIRSFSATQLKAISSGYRQTFSLTQKSHPSLIFAERRLLSSLAATLTEESAASFFDIACSSIFKTIGGLLILPHFATPKSEQIYAALGHVARILVILGVSWMATRLIERWFPRLRVSIVEHMVGYRGGADIELEKRAATLGGILRKTLALVIWITAIVMALKEAGFDIGPILAGAGVVGLAVGFGAQNLVQDVISGMFLLLENQIRVNDVAILNGTGGMVEAINLRTTVLRGLDGTVHVFRNGAVTTLANMTHSYSYYVFGNRSCLQRRHRPRH